MQIERELPVLRDQAGDSIAESSMIMQHGSETDVCIECKKLHDVIWEIIAASKDLTCRLEFVVKCLPPYEMLFVDANCGS